MTTLSTLIGSALPSFGESAATHRPSFWKRVGGAFRRRGDETSEAVAANEAATVHAASIEALHKVVDDAELDALGIERADISDSMDEPHQLDFGNPSNLPPNPPRRRLWGAKRDTALDEVRSGMSALASLLNGIHQHMEHQGARQDELADRQREVIACLSHLPTASALQTESLAAIRDQITQTASHQSRLCTALERLGGIQENTGEALTSIARRVEQMDARDAVYTASMEKVCDAMQTVSRASETGAVVLERVQKTLVTQQDGMTATLDKHQTKFNALMAVAIAVSVAALAVVAGVGYMVLVKIS